MRWLLSFVLLLLALGTLRMVGCGDEEVVPEYPLCLRDEHCDDSNACTFDFCSAAELPYRCEHWEEPCPRLCDPWYKPCEEGEWHSQCADLESYDCDPDTGVVECTWGRTDWHQGQGCCIDEGVCYGPAGGFWYCCKRRGYCINGACVEGNGYPTDCTERDDGEPCDIGDTAEPCWWETCEILNTLGLCWKGNCAVLDCSGLVQGTLCWGGLWDSGRCDGSPYNPHCLYRAPSGGPPGWTCQGEYYGTDDGCDCGCGIIDPDCTDGTVGSCDYCGVQGSCNCCSCPGDIDPAQNWLCLGGREVCGNDVVEHGELCDGDDLRGLDCTDFNFTEGTLACTMECTFDTSGCTVPDLCEGVTCRDTECRSGGVCDPDEGECDYETVAENGTACSEGECLDGVCAPAGAFRCTEQGIRDAIAQGGGPHLFACDGSTTVVTKAEIIIDNDVVLDGEGNLRVDANDAHRVFSVAPRVTADLRGMTVTGGRATEALGEGGGIYNAGDLTLTNSTVSGNTAYDGGGIHNDSDSDYQSMLTLTNSTVSGNSASRGGGILSWGTLTVTNSTVSGNASYGNGGGAYIGRGGTVSNSTVSGNTAAWRGGGIAFVWGALTVTNSTVSGNSADNGGGISTSGDLTVTNSTVSGNTAGHSGGGIDNTATLTLTSSTVSGNSAEYKGDGVYNDPGEATLTRSIIDGDCGYSANISGGYNIESPGDTCRLDPDGTDLVDVPDPMLGPLQDNGGPTQTHALLPGSVAIDWIPEADCGATTDQRGEPRPETGGTMCDVGAFEVQP